VTNLSPMRATYVVCESVNPAASDETGDPGIVTVRLIVGGEKGAMLAASTAAKKSGHVAWHALRVERPEGSRFPLCGDRLATRKEGDDYVAIAPPPGLTK
jgi:hypothetical protein